jgi:hypothetical protein
MGNCGICQRRPGAPIAPGGFALCGSCLERVADKAVEGGTAALGLGKGSKTQSEGDRALMEEAVESRLATLVSRMHLLKARDELSPASANVILSLFYAQEGKRGETVAAADKALLLAPPPADRELLATALVRVMSAEELLALRGIIFPN